MSDLDPTLESEFARSLIRYPAPDAHLPARARQPPLRRLAVSGVVIGLAIVLAAAGGRSIADLRSRLALTSAASATAAGDATYVTGTCVATAQTMWTFRPPYYDGRPQPMVVAGHLASVPRRNLLVGDDWFLSEPARAAIELRVTRLDRPAPPIALHAIGYPIAPGLPGDFDTGWFYRTSVDAVTLLPTAAGCWKVEVVGADPGDALVYELRGVAPPGRGRDAP